MKVQITVNQTIKLEASWENNAASKALVAQMPFTLTMSNIYKREMCHRLGAGSLPVKKAPNKPYRIGDIAYWPPLGSLVILYEQNGEVFEQVSLGHISNDISFFKQLDHAQVTFELMEDSK